MRIVFMGTPDFAVNALDALVSAGHEIVGVFTQPDKPQGRKMVLTAPPVKVFAESKGLTVYQPNSVKTDEAYELLKSLNPDLIAVVAYGKILPKNILDLPKFGCVNAHASLLPKYRGASPIQCSIYYGDKKTGVTTMLMDEGMDTGDMLLTAETDILPTDNFETLHDRLAEMGAKLLSQTVTALQNGTVTPVKQPDEDVSYAPIITKEMGKIDFNSNSNEIDCKIRAFTPWPSAYFYHGEKNVKVISAVIGDKTNEAAGTVIENKTCLTVACGGGTSIKFVKVQPQGKGVMTAKDFINGHHIALGTKL